MAKDTSLGLHLSKNCVYELQLALASCLLVLCCVGHTAGEPLPCLEWDSEWYLPVDVADRQSPDGVELTGIGGFGEPRKQRPGIPAHLHTGTDIKRPSDNYEDEPVYPCAAGLVVSVRDDGPFSQVIVRHPACGGDTIWTVYEHVGGIAVLPGDSVGPYEPLARFMTRGELEQFGWQFDHVHIEVLKVRPPAMEARDDLPYRHFGTYALTCYTRHELMSRYWPLLVFLDECWSGQR